MESKEKLKEIDIKNCTCYYFEDIIKIENVNFGIVVIDENHMEKFCFVSFQTKLCLMQSHCILALIK